MSGRRACRKDRVRCVLDIQFLLSKPAWRTGGRAWGAYLYLPSFYFIMLWWHAPGGCGAPLTYHLGDDHESVRANSLFPGAPVNHNFVLYIDSASE